MPGSASARTAVLASSVSPSGSGMNGLGAASRDKGHKRVPAPPDRITGMIGWIFIEVPLKIGLTGNFSALRVPNQTTRLNWQRGVVIAKWYHCKVGGAGKFVA